MTARQLLERLTDAGCSPAVKNGCLTLAADPPAGLADLLAVAHTGVRAILTGRRWFGLLPDGEPVQLGVDRLIPAGVRLFAVDRDSAWDRPRAACRSGVAAALFAEESTSRPKNRREAESHTEMLL